jgi:hypothetical protein
MGCNPALADTEISGFAYNTTFGDQHWQQSRSVVAANFDYTTNVVDVRGQFSTYENEPIRRLTIGRTFNSYKDGHISIRAGRFSRVDSFFNNVVDTPAASGMDILPMAGYNYRMFQGSFTIMDGIKVDTYNHFGDHALSLHYSKGMMVIPDQKEYQNEVLHKVYPGISLDSMVGDTIEFHHEWHNWHSYVSKTLYGATSERLANDTTSHYVATNAHQADYTLRKAGVKYENDLGFVMVERSEGNTETYSITGNTTAIGVAYDTSKTLGWYFMDTWTAYVGQSYGENVTSKTEAKDGFIGVTKRVGRLTVSTAFHEGKGQGWMRYEANSPYEWQSYVISTTYQF